MNDLLPQVNFNFPQGTLPKWLLLVGATAVLNAIQNIFQPSFSTKVYSSAKGVAQVTPLSARMFAVWNLTSAMVRIYAAYHIYEEAETLIFRTTKIGAGIVSPLIVASTSLYAMIAQYKFYIA
ncbi:ergosterol biosynthesis protein [Malassezia cuniculi]|uniref:Ergosterol biosynthesis protein n=1 Tax=Malassezia cuniculi TaxID=948313 RepID=A0AAF0JD13_9BASI|nr:ergosterol biosynthesis protein [Malassezia cuniculi]